jgi:hypothetical protein
MTVLVNWQTTGIGLLTMAWAALDAWHNGHISDADQAAFLTATGLIFAKDHNK